MKILAAVWVMVLWAFFAGFGALGCTYETVQEYNRETAAAEVADAGADEAGKAGDDAMSIRDRGAGRVVTLTRGDYAERNVMNESFMNDAGTAVAGTYTIEFDVRPKNPIPTNTTEPATLTYAIIRWAIGGQQIQRIVSVASGTSVTGVGAGCTVQVYDATGQDTNAPPLVKATDPVPQYDVTCTVSPGERADSALPAVYYPPTASGVLPPLAVPPTPNVIIPIPRNAGITSVKVVTYQGGPAVVLRGPTGGALATYDPTIYNEFQPIPPSAITVQINNFSNSQFLDWMIVFGVDG